MAAVIESVTEITYISTCIHYSNRQQRNSNGSIYSIVVRYDDRISVHTARRCSRVAAVNTS